MPISTDAGFSAVIVPYPTEQVAKPLIEYKISQTVDKVECYIQAESLTSFRIYFTRCTPVDSLECYVAIIKCEGISCKAYAIGEGVVRSLDDYTWHLKGCRTDFNYDLNRLNDNTIELKLIRAVIKEGVVLGNGELLVENFSVVDDSDFVLFRWYLVNSEQVSLLKLDYKPDQTLTLSNSLKGYPVSRTTRTEEFLLAKDEILISLLTIEQRILFLANLIKSPTTLPYLTESNISSINEVKKELELELESDLQRKTNQGIILPIKFASLLENGNGKGKGKGKDKLPNLDKSPISRSNSSNILSPIRSPSIPNIRSSARKGSPSKRNSSLILSSTNRERKESIGYGENSEEKEN